MATFYRIYKVNPSDSFTTIDTYDDLVFLRKNSYDIGSALISSTIDTANISIQITNLSRPEVVNVLYTSILDGTGTPYASFAACLTALNGLFSASGGGGGGGDATAANQTTQINAANALNTNIGATNDPLSGTPATVASLISIMKGFWSALVTKLSDKSQNTQIVDSGLIDGVKVVSNSLQVKQVGDVTFSNTSILVSNFPVTQPVSGSISVSNFPASQAVTGTFFQATQPISAASLPLPSGASTATNQSTLNTNIGAQADAASSTFSTVASLISILKGLWRDSINGTQIANQTPLIYGTPSNIATNAIGTAIFTIVVANASRKGLVIGNKTNNTLYIDINNGTPVGGTGATAVYHYSIATNSSLTVTGVVVTAQINGIFSTSPNNNGIILTQIT